jgi:RimJ/RimL family protein N-acetyltransferase
MVIDYCFNEKGFTTLWGDYFPSNPASGRVMEKCGFVDTGVETLCPDLEMGSDCPVRVMKLESSEYRAMSTSALSSRDLIRQNVKLIKK